jgi:hypothetical protein
MLIANRQYNIYPRKFKIYYNAIFLSIVTYAIQINTKKSAFGGKP